MRASLIRYIFSEPRVYGSIYGLSLSLFLISIMHPYVRFEGFKKSKMLLNLLAAKPDRIEITNTGSMILLFSGHVLKVPLCEYARITLYQDHLNFKALQSSMKRKLFQYEFKENFLCGFSYYEMARLEKVEALDVEMVDYLLIALKGEKIVDSGSLCSLEQQIKGGQLLCDYSQPYERTKIRETVNRLMSVPCDLSPMHGDLTPSNIMLNNSSPVLIDLDRYCESGLPFIDTIHYRIEYKAGQSKIGSFDVMGHVFRGILKDGLSSTDELMSYLLYRVGAEYRKGYRRNRKYYAKAKDILIGLIEQKESEEKLE